MKDKFLYLIWRDPVSRRNYTVGKLTRGSNYKFEYCEEDGKAVAEAGWQPLEAFPEGKVYESEILFPVFSSRIPDRKRRDIQKILDKYGLKEFDEFELLRKSGARLPIDTYEFIDPIFESDKVIEREFYIMGVRHHADCDGKNCSLRPNLELGEDLFFEPEPDNENDSFAIKILTENDILLGYVPRYYNKAILGRLSKGVSYSCKVIELSQEQSCSECIKVRLNMPKIDG